ncbi:MAG: aminoacyl-tRNA hydrolase [Mycoplasmataceae bacterium]|jgi:PTH1 family peptidyl-tRNA hydrolase|nr:aminoacyl-tRNA hydrolase [Mycoplasmataceae bacterium]
MKLIVGLGNYPAEYNGTRHNAGFSAIDIVAAKKSIDLDKNKFNGIYAKVGDDLIIAKPYTYMNLSGKFIQPLCQFFKISPEDVLVICDDLETEPGKIRIRKNGSSGGQNGLNSIISEMGTQDFKRIRIGIGRPADHFIPISDYVTGKPNNEEDIKKLNSGIEKAANAIIDYIDGEPFEKIMSKYN